MGDCLGLAVLPEGVVVAADLSGRLRIFDFDSGALVNSIAVPSPLFVTAYQRAYDGRSVIYACTGHEVSCYLLDSSRGLERIGVLDAAASYGRKALTIMPPAVGKRESYLIIGWRGKPDLLVLSLPDHKVVHRYILTQEECPDCKLAGLAADRAGTSLEICNESSSAVHVLAWPLPGMPPLV